MHSPAPRIELGLALRGVASAAIDVSDGLLADLGHICERSHLAANIDWPSVPLSPALLSVGAGFRIACALSGGDDYELCFTAPVSTRYRVNAISVETDTTVTRIGTMMAGEGSVQVRDEKSQPMKISATGFDHFSS